MSRIGKIIFYGVVILLLAISFIILFGVENAKEIEMTKESNGVSMGLTLAYILAGAGILGMLAIAVKGMVNKPKSAVKVGIGVAIMVVLFLVGYVIDAGTTSDAWKEFGVTTSTSSKMIGGALIMMYIGLFGGLLLVMFGPLLRLIKK
jgi:hypothetical protein